MTLPNTNESGDINTGALDAAALVIEPTSGAKAGVEPIQFATGLRRPRNVGGGRLRPSNGPQPGKAAPPTTITNDSDGFEFLRALAISAAILNVSIIGASSLLLLSVASVAIAGFVCFARPEASRFTKSSAASPIIRHSPVSASLSRAKAGRVFVLDFTGRLRSCAISHGARTNDHASTGAG